jgi:hypothetical protein
MRSSSACKRKAIAECHVEIQDLLAFHPVIRLRTTRFLSLEIASSYLTPRMLAGKAEFSRLW